MAQQPAAPFSTTPPDDTATLVDSTPLSRRRPPRALQWMTVGIGIKRWALLTILGLLLAIIGAPLFTAYFAVDFSINMLEWIAMRTNRTVDTVSLGIILLAAGVIMVVVGLRGTFRAVERAFSTGEKKSDFLETVLRRRRLEQGERVVAIGGGTGLSTMLRGLKDYTSNITAVVTMADDGGSSGILREHGVLPPGDLRNCIAALAEAEPLMTKLFQHRFAGIGPLKGHSVGNLIVAAMFEMTGDFESAVRETSDVLAIRGSVLPSTLDDIRLGAMLKDGTRVMGQSAVNKSSEIDHTFLVPEEPLALPGVVRAIREADVIIIGPGSLFTSIIPNLLVPAIGQAIKESPAPKIYVCNVMTQPHETASYKASDHVKALIRHIGPGVITHVLVNKGKVQPDVLAKYQSVGAEYVEPDEDAIAILGVRPMHGNFIDDTNLVRHDSSRLASAIFRIVARL